LGLYNYTLMKNGIDDDSSYGCDCILIFSLLFSYYVLSLYLQGASYYGINDFCKGYEDDNTLFYFLSCYFVIFPS
jgi:hypothetical protein